MSPSLPDCLPITAPVVLDIVVRGLRGYRLDRFDRFDRGGRFNRGGRFDRSYKLGVSGGAWRCSGFGIRRTCRRVR